MEGVTQTVVADVATVSGDSVSVKEEKDAVKGLLEKMIDDESEIATFFCGKDVTEEEKALVEEMCLEINKNLDVEIIDGNQDIYSYIIAVE